MHPEDFQIFRSDEESFFEEFESEVERKDVEYILAVIQDEIESHDPVYLRPQEYLQNELSELPTRSRLLKVASEETASAYIAALEQLEHDNPEFYGELDPDGDASAKFTSKRIKELTKFLLFAADPESWDRLEYDQHTLIVRDRSKRILRRVKWFEPNMEDITVLCQPNVSGKLVPILVEKHSGKIFAVSRSVAERAREIPRIQALIAKCQSTSSKWDNKPALKDIDVSIYKSCILSVISQALGKYQMMRSKARSDTHLKVWLRALVKRSYLACLFSVFCETHSSCTLSKSAKQFSESLKMFRSSCIQKEFGTGDRKILVSQYDSHRKKYDRLLDVLQMKASVNTKCLKKRFTKKNL